MVGIDTRTTMDMDATIKGQTLAAPEITGIIESILSTPIDDDVEFTFLGIEEIREEADYPGYRVSKLMFEDRTISIMAYNLETVLAEKFETIITRGITNTRMRDFYDIFILTATQTFDSDTFKAALKKTAEKRGTAEQMSDTIEETITIIMENPIMVSLWHRYQKRYAYATDVSWDMAIGALKALTEKLKIV